MEFDSPLKTLGGDLAGDAEGDRGHYRGQDGIHAQSLTR